MSRTPWGPGDTMRTDQRPLKVATRVRTPLGVPQEVAGQKSRQNSRGLLRSPACHPPCHPLASPRTLAERWRAFESCLPGAGSSGSTWPETHSRACGPPRPSTPRGSAMPSAGRARGKSSCASMRPPHPRGTFGDLAEQWMALAMRRELSSIGPLLRFGRFVFRQGSRAHPLALDDTLTASIGT